jgi:hypothetical protein
MTTTYVGGMSIGGAVPAAGLAVTAGADGLNAAYPDIEAQIAAMVASIAQLATMPPIPSFPDMVARAAANLAGLEVAIAMPGLPPPPSIATAIAALTVALTNLQNMLLGINAKLDVIADVQGLLLTAGVHAFAHDGQRSQIGAELQTAVNTHVPGTGSTNTRAVVLVTTSGATWTAMQSMFRVTP